jgi:hypothetical protein
LEEEDFNTSFWDDIYDWKGSIEKETQELKLHLKSIDQKLEKLIKDQFTATEKIDLLIKQINAFAFPQNLNFNRGAIVDAVPVVTNTEVVQMRETMEILSQKVEDLIHFRDYFASFKK